ncbi:MAG: DNA-binding response regulator [Gammaproteobacteria bacterium]|jgi:DNA-binding response OmpR family regulator|nr:DNA-binding response regulator [Gammaproteobacteria bacterium]
MAAPAPQLLIVDDDRALAAMLLEYLELQGFQVITAGSGEQALAELSHRPIDLIVLDLGLPGIDGFETLHRLRLEHAMPVIMLTARGEEQDRIAGLTAGADDYLPKPFNPLELAARVRAVLKRSSAGSVTAREQSAGFGNLLLHSKRREVRVAGAAVPLTATELRVLEALLQRQGEVLSRAELTEVAVGRPLEPYDRSIDTLVSKLRRKLALAGAEGAEIRSLRGHGYVLDVMRQNAERSPGADT